MADGPKDGKPSGARHRMVNDSSFPPFAVNAPMPRGTAVPPKAVKPRPATAQAPQTPPVDKKR